MIRLAASPLALCLLCPHLCGCDLAPKEKGRTTVSVFAATSLTEAATDLEHGFEERHAHTDIQFTFSGSQVLRLQIERGAPADVFASADENHLDALSQQNLVAPPQVFAHNELVVIVPESNPAQIGAFAELPRAKRLVIGTENVPVGIYTRRMLELASLEFGASFSSAVLANVVSEETNVRLVRAKVALGEADAAVVYRTDVPLDHSLRTVEIPGSVNQRAVYAIAMTRDSTATKEADAFVKYVLSPRGQGILRRHGFLPRTLP